MVALETDAKFTRPGLLLLVTGIIAFALRWVVRSIPFIGGLLGWVLMLAGIFFIVGGAFLLITKRN